MSSGEIRRLDWVSVSVPNKKIIEHVHLCCSRCGAKEKVVLVETSEDFGMKKAIVTFESRHEGCLPGMGRA